MRWRKAPLAPPSARGPLIGPKNLSKLRRATLIERCEPRYLLSAIGPSNIPTTVFNITTYGASTSSANNVVAINAAITAAAANKVNGISGGVVEIPAGTWMAGPTSANPVGINLASNVDLQIDSGATLQAIPDTSYLNAGNSSVLNFITAKSISNFEITGSGTIDGNGAGWWSTYGSSNNRPRLVYIDDSSTLMVSGVTLQNSPFFNLSFSNSSNVIVNGITVSNPSTSPNTDGIDPAGSHYLIENSTISTGDDDIAVKPQSVFCSDITITNMTINAGHGLSIGGETNDGLNGLYVSNVTFNGTTNGIRLKADRTNGGVVQNVYYSNITMTNVQYPILIDSYYNGSNSIPSNPSSDPGSTYIAGSTPLWENIYFTNLTSTSNSSSEVAGIIFGLPEAPVTNVTFTNVKITAKTTGLQIDHARNVTFDSNSSITLKSPATADVYGATSGFPSPYDATLLPALFANTDIGSPTVATGTSESLYDPDSTQWTIVGDGSGFSATSDQFNFSYGHVTGNYTLQAQLKSLASVSGATPQAGVMFRNSTSATDPFAALVQTTGNQIVFEYRTTAGGAVTVSAPVSATVGTYYLQIVRSGSNFSGFYSTDGSTWTQVGSTVQIAAIANTAQAGLAATSGSNGSPSAAVFANVSALPGGPTLVQPANAIYNPVTTTSANLSALATDNAGASTLTYTWAYTGPAGVTYTSNTNGTNAAQNITANFTQAGAYTFTVTIADGGKLAVNSSVAVTVSQALTAITVTPSTATVVPSATKQFSAVAYDQFGNALTVQPAFTWSVTSGAGSVNSSGLYTAPSSNGSATVTTGRGSLTGSASVTIAANSPPTVATPAAANPNPVTGTSTALTVLGSENGSDTGLTYTWSYTGPTGVTYTGSTNGTNAAKNITANFTQAGTYNFTATITDPNNLSTTSSIAVTVNQTPTTIVVSPGTSPVVPIGFTQQFSASATDQFGNAISSPNFTWGITGTGNSIDGTGDVTLGSTPGSFTVSATDGSAQGTATVIAEDFAVPNASTLDINLSSAGPVTISSTGNNITASQNGVQITLSGFTGITVTDTGSGDALNFNGPVALPIAFTNTGTSTINVNSGALTFAPNQGGNINLGSLNIANGASAAITAATTDTPTTLILNSISIGSTGYFDVTNNKVLINYATGSDPISSIAGWIATGYASSAWNGFGIISTTAQSNSNYALGYADAADTNNPAGLPANQIEILYTLVGDANLDGAVNSIDFAILSSNFNKADVGPSQWDQGDFNYDGSVNSIDFAALSSNFNKGSQIAVAAAVLTETETTASNQSPLSPTSSPQNDGYASPASAANPHGSVAKSPSKNMPVHNNPDTRSIRRPRH